MSSKLLPSQACTEPEPFLHKRQSSSIYSKSVTVHTEITLFVQSLATFTVNAASL